VEEHLRSATLRGLLSSLMRITQRADGPLVLLATPSGERQEMALLMGALVDEWRQAPAPIRKRPSSRYCHAA
jgi:hypothetical protein